MKTITYNPVLWQLVPIVPTSAMIEAANARANDGTTFMYSKTYAAMLAAAPSAPEQPKQEGLTKYQRDARGGQHGHYEYFYACSDVDALLASQPTYTGKSDERLLQDALDVIDSHLSHQDFKVAGDIRNRLASQPAAPVAAVEPKEGEQGYRPASCDLGKNDQVCCADGCAADKELSEMAPASPAAVLGQDAGADDGFCETCLSFGEINGGPCPDCAVKQGDAYKERQAVRDRAHAKGAAIGDAPCGIGPAQAVPSEPESIAPKRPGGTLLPGADKFVDLMRAWRFANVGSESERTFAATVDYINAWHAAGIAALQHQLWCAGVNLDGAKEHIQELEAAQGQDGAVAEWVNEEQGFQYLQIKRLPDGAKLYTHPQAAQPVDLPDEVAHEIIGSAIEHSDEWAEAAEIEPTKEQVSGETLRYILTVLAAAQGQKP